MQTQIRPQILSTLVTMSVYCTTMTLAITLVLPLLHTTKVGRRCSLKYSISLVHTPHKPPGSLRCYTQGQNHNDFRDFLEESVLRKFNATFVLILSQETMK